MKYLDPKADLTFKRIFGEHADMSNSEHKAALAWYKFLDGIDENTREIPKELLAEPEEVQTMAYSKDELSAYEDFWDKMGAERLLFIDSAKRNLEQGREEGRKEGRAEGIVEGIAEGEKRRAQEIARNMLAKGMEPGIVADLTGLSEEEIKH